jgi:divinyl chlorophyllide a 8-vinyl-reductase
MNKVMVFGATGTIGSAVVKALSDRGYAPVAITRQFTKRQPFADITNCTVAAIDIFDDDALTACLKAHQPVAIISCLASRTGDPDDARKIDLEAQSHILDAAKSAAINHFILLSAICVQRPQLAFQHAKLAFEKQLIASGLTYSIVRPTAFFKSLSGQVARVKAGKPFLVFGDGRLTACKPISDRDLAHYLVNCLKDHSLHDCILPIGGPGPAITPRAQGEELFRLTGKPVKFRHISVGFMDFIIKILDLFGNFIPAAARKAQFARIGRYYATQSMLVWNDKTKRYDEKATPSYGSDQIYDHYAKLVAGDEDADLGDHAAF